MPPHPQPNPAIARSLLVPLLLVVVAAATTQARDLRMAATVHRHGDRTMLVEFPNDAGSNGFATFSPPGKGLLTKEGMTQHYELGQQLRTRWAGFLSEEYSRRELLVRSTDVDRTLQSVASQLSGLYPVPLGEGFAASLPWMPIPIHTLPREEDKLLLAYSGNTCPTFAKSTAAWRAGAAYQAKEEANKDLLEHIATATGLEDVNLSVFYTVYDTLVVQQAHNRTMLPYFTDAVRARMAELAKWLNREWFSGERVRARLSGGFLVTKILADFEERIAHPEPAQMGDVGTKVRIYSAHDTTVSAVLAALDVFDGVNPPYASIVIFELYQEDDGTYTVQFEYNGERMKFPGCDDYACPIASVKDGLSDLPTIDEFDEVCDVPAAAGSDKDDDDTGVSLGSLVILGIALMVFAGAIYLRYDTETRKRRSESDVDMVRQSLLEDPDV